MPKKFSQIIIGLVILLGIVFLADQYSGYQEEPEALKLWFFDVGQGDAILFDTPNKQQILIDGGPDNTILARLSQALPLRDKTIDLIIITHNHADHIAGTIEVLRHYTVSEIWLTGAIHTTDTYRNLLEEIRKSSARTKTVSQGEVISFGELKGIVLWPDRSVIGELPDNQNSLSLTTFWQYHSTTILLTGDLEKEQEFALLRQNLLKPTTILKVGHQGSRTSSSNNFLETLRPNLAIISVGQNTYNHPHKEVLDRFLNLSIPVLRTDRDRSIVVTMDKNGYRYRTGL